MDAAHAGLIKMISASRKVGSVGSMAQHTAVLTAPVNELATVAFIDLAGFSAITDVYGDSSAIAILEIFEGMVRNALEDHAPPIKWIGDEVMLSFPSPKIAIKALGSLLSACRHDPRLPLTRTALHHGPVLRRAGDLFGSTVNISARMAALAAPGQLLATEPVAKAASTEGIVVRDLGKTALRSLSDKISIYEIQLAPTPDRAWIDPVCKMHAPYSTFQRAVLDGPWFCSKRCEEAYYRSPQTYAWPE
jgi:adenylate cyclase